MKYTGKTFHFTAELDPSHPFKNKKRPLWSIDHFHDQLIISYIFQPLPYSGSKTMHFFIVTQWLNEIDDAQVFNVIGLNLKAKLEKVIENGQELKKKQLELENNNHKLVLYNVIAPKKNSLC